MKYLATLFFLFVTSVSASDWNQWRGPNRDGSVSAFKVPEKFPDQLKTV